ncbi:MAG: hypothetical protein CMQ05_16625 [Gammaproteobacteria bacterium]|uniref:DUF2232 domain-containing protein n=1 Tax=OM182 bacterium MED-G24 TaxID=1986255 RepID=A0A2A5WVQ2_9GAMM|nr:hypothetical protein [Gammaproteobacteria bacterium]PDH40297.1 MAG: hypothetical protein CNE99_03790 [OM182 bacterium MED-G24]
MRALAERVMMGPRHAIFLTVVLSAIPIPPVQFLGIALVGLVLLRHGAQRGLLVAGWNLLPLGFWTVFLGGPPITMQLLLVMIVGALVLRETSSWRAVTVVAVIHGAILTLVVEPFAMEWFRQVMEPVVSYQEQHAPEGMTERQLYKEMLALMGAIHSLFFVGLMMLARWWQSTLFNPQAFGREMRGLRLTPMFTIGLIVAAVLCFVAGTPQTIFLVFVPAIVAGLALIHWLVADRNLGVGPLVALYVIVFVLNQLAILLIVLLSLIDSSFDLRKKLASQRVDDE